MVPWMAYLAKFNQKLQHRKTCGEIHSLDNGGRRKESLNNPNNAHLSPTYLWSEVESLTAFLLRIKFQMEP